MKEGYAMFRFPVRLFAVAAIVLSLTVLSVPTAHARPLDERKAPAHLDSSWFQAALSWIFSLVPTQGHGPMQQATAATSSTDLTLLQPNTGSCIDPLGGGRCNF
jgi:hypothetical protein